VDLIASRSDGYYLYKDGAYYQESNLDLSKTELSDAGYMALSEAGILTQIYFSESGIREWLNNNATESDVDIFMEIIEPLIVKLWQERKLERLT